VNAPREWENFAGRRKSGGRGVLGAGGTSKSKTVRKAWGWPRDYECFKGTAAFKGAVKGWCAGLWDLTLPPTLRVSQLMIEPSSEQEGGVMGGFSARYILSVAGRTQRCREENSGACEGSTSREMTAVESWPKETSLGSGGEKCTGRGELSRRCLVKKRGKGSVPYVEAANERFLGKVKAPLKKKGSRATIVRGYIKEKNAFVLAACYMPRMMGWI